MAIHDWTKVDAGIFHAFHHMWIDELARSLNRGRLPTDYYALPEQIDSQFGPDVLTLKANPSNPDDPTERHLMKCLPAGEAFSPTETPKL